MTIEEIIDTEVMTRLSMFKSIRGLDPFALHLLKTSEHPILRFRRYWMRKTAVKQHLAAERRQQWINDEFKQTPYVKGSLMRRSAVLDPHLAQESRHYNKREWYDKGFLNDVRKEAPAIFPKRETL